MPATTLSLTGTAAAMYYGSMAAAAVSMVTGVTSSLIQSKQQAAQAKAQSKQAKYQSEVAKQNQEMAQREARAKAQQGLENAYALRRKAAAEASQRTAQEGASGLVAGYGSFEDINADQLIKYSAEERAAIQKGYDDAYNSEVAAWGYGNQATGYEMQADAYDSRASGAYLAGGLGAFGSIASGIADIGSTWNSFRTPDDASKKGGKA